MSQESYRKAMGVVMQQFYQAALLDTLARAGHRTEKISEADSREVFAGTSAPITGGRVSRGEKLRAMRKLKKLLAERPRSEDTDVQAEKP